MTDEIYKKIMAADEASRRITGIIGRSDEQIRTAQMLAERLAMPDFTTGFASQIEKIQSSLGLFESFNVAEHFKELSATTIAAEQARLLAESSVSKQILEAMHAANGPLSDLRAAGLLDSMGFASDTAKQMQLALAEYESRFRLPSAMETRTLLESVKLIESPFSTNNIIDKSLVERAMEEMRSPWIDIHEQYRSITAFTELHGIGQSLSALSPFEDTLIEALRSDIGDWRDRISWPEQVYTDLLARGEFYVERGFNPSLTDFPAGAFEESLEITGVADEPPPLVAHYGSPLPHSHDSNEEEGFRRTNKAHDWLQRFESQLRRFINEIMTQAFGPDWPRHRLPNGLYEQWVDKKRKAEEFGGPTFPLICYADFTDYERIICKGDNWKMIFQIHFRRPEAFRESMQRLYLPRISTMHSRPITQDDELLVYVEVKRLAKVFI